MLRLLLSTILAVILFSSCTMILATRYPGNPGKTLPKEWLGKYEVISVSPIPDKRDTGQSEKEYAIVESTRVTWKSAEGDKVYSLSDSLKYSVMPDQSQYLSVLMAQGLYAVFKVIKNGDALELYSISCDDEPKKSELNKYFKDVQKIKKGDDEYYKVTLVEKKLDAFFKSSIASKEITRLVPVK